MKSTQLILLVIPVLLFQCKEEPTIEELILPEDPQACRLTTEIAQYVETRSLSITYEYDGDLIARVRATLRNASATYDLSGFVSYDEERRFSRLEIAEDQFSFMEYRGDTIIAVHQHPEAIRNHRYIYLKDEMGNIYPLDGNEYIFNDQGQLTDIFYQNPNQNDDPELTTSAHFEYDDNPNPFYHLPFGATFVNEQSGNPTKLMFLSYDRRSFQGPNNLINFSFVMADGTTLGDTWNYRYNDLGYPTEINYGYPVAYKYDCY